MSWIRQLVILKCVSVLLMSFYRQSVYVIYLDKIRRMKGADDDNLPKVMQYSETSEMRGETVGKQNNKYPQKVL